MNSDLLQVLTNIVNDLGAPLFEALYWVSYAVGLIVFGGSWLIPLGGRGNIGLALRGIIAGACLLSFPTILDALSETLFQSSAPDMLASTGGSSPLAGAVNFSVWAMRILGAGAVAKGIYLAKQGSGPNGSSGTYRAAIYCTSGTVLLNCVAAARAFGLTAGGIVQDVINKLLS